jgi:cell wall assembly regulator SMI1
MEEILRKYNWPRTSPSDNKDIADIEKEIGFELPTDYKTFLSQHSGHETQIGKEYIKLWDKKDLLPLNKAYQIIENLPGTIGIGDNGAGEFIAIEKLSGGEQRVILSPLIDFNKQHHIEIGKSFTDFLLRLDREEEWFKGI